VLRAVKWVCVCVCTRKLEKSIFSVLFEARLLSDSGQVVECRVGSITGQSTVVRGRSLQCAVALLFRCRRDVFAARVAEAVARTVQESQHDGRAVAEGSKDVGAGRRHTALCRRCGEELGEFEVRV